MARHPAPWRLRIGASPGDEGTRFRIWAPAARRVELVLQRNGREEMHPLQPQEGGYHQGHVAAATAGMRYRYRLDGEAVYPDPASRYQPEGVHGASQIVDPGAFRWNDPETPALSADDLVIYELHVGTFTPAGTFDAAIERLDRLADLGVTAIEIMPVAQCPGSRNWGYDGVYLFAPSAAYGGPDGLKRLVDAAHGHGLGVILDVVYNHLGPEGNYLPAVTGGHFFTERHHTPWGGAVNFDGPDSGPVREFVVENALYWAHEYHVDGLRLDATHAIIDDSPVHILREIAEHLHGLERPRLVIAEDDRNERRLVLPRQQGGFGLDAVWADDLHHQLRRLTAGDRDGYFESYRGRMDDIVTTLGKGWFFEGQYSRHHGKDRGTAAEGLPPRVFVHSIQNHDQVGNRARGERLHHDLPLPVYRALSALLLLSPYTPLLFMGQEWAASSPFLYFTDHPETLGRLVTEGRREEFKTFAAFTDPATRESIPDPQAPGSFHRSKLQWDESDQPPHHGIRELYRSLLRMRRREPALRDRDRKGFAAAQLGQRALGLRREAAGQSLLLIVNLGTELAVDLKGQPETRPPTGGDWTRVLWTEEERFGGNGTHPVEAGRVVRLPSAGAALYRAG